MNLLRIVERSLTTVILVSLVTPRIYSQTPATLETPQAVLTRLFLLTYPPLARQTRISGDVDMLVEITKDGTVKSAVAVKGHPLLTAAAIDSAQKSEFQCAGCNDEGSSVHLIYTFHLEYSDTCPPEEKSPGDPHPAPVASRIAQTLNHITVTDQVVGTCDPVGTIIKVRSIKCLYLWYCSKRYPL